MRKIIQKIKSKWQLYIELLFTAVAFFVMVAFCYLFTRSIVFEHMKHHSESSLAFEMSLIETALIEPRVTLGILSETVRGMLVSGVGKDELQKYIDRLSDYMHMPGKVESGYNGFYGYFKSFADSSVSVA